MTGERSKRYRRYRFFDILTHRGISWAHFAQRLGVSRQHLYQVASGKSDLSAGRKRLSATILDLPEDFLFTDTTAPPEAPDA